MFPVYFQAPAQLQMAWRSDSGLRAEKGGKEEEDEEEERTKDESLVFEVSCG